MVLARAEHHQIICLSGLSLNSLSLAAVRLHQANQQGLLYLSACLSVCLDVCLDVCLSAEVARRRFGASTLPSLQHACCVVKASGKLSKLRVLVASGKEVCALLDS